MRINEIDVRRYGAKLLSVDVQPPKMEGSYEMLPRALLPTEYDADIPLGTLKITIYFTEKNRAALQRTMSSFMQLFRSSCVLDEIKGYKGKYKGFLKDDTYTNTLKQQKKILELYFEGYFFDEEKVTVFDGKTFGKLYVEGSRNTPCSIEVTAVSEIENFTIALNRELYKIEALEEGKSVCIDGRTGKATIEGKNAFGIIDMWQFPKLKTGENIIEFSSEKAKVKVKYTPMWI